MQRENHSYLTLIHTYRQFREANSPNCMSEDVGRKPEHPGGAHTTHTQGKHANYRIQGVVPTCMRTTAVESIDVLTVPEMIFTYHVKLFSQFYVSKCNDCLDYAYRQHYCK